MNWSFLFAVLIPIVSACGGASGGSASSSSNTSSSSTSSSASGGTLPNQCAGPCNAATPVPPTLSSDGGLGNVTMYSTSASAGGACGYGSTNIKYYAAINVNVASGDGQGQWQGGKICGQCAEVSTLTSLGLKTVTVRIMDKCPDGNCGIDLGGLAPGAVMPDGSGRYAGQWRFVSCTGHPEVFDGAPSLNVKDGSNIYWSRVRVHNPATGVAGIAWQDSAGNTGSFVFDTTNVENAYEVPSGLMQSSASSVTVTVNYVDGTKATAQITPAQLGAAGASYTLN